MGIKDVQEQIGPEQFVTIITVDRKRGRVEAMLKDRGIIYIPIWYQGTVFRWPKTGERWVARKETNQWKLLTSVDPGRTMKSGEMAEEPLLNLNRLKEGEVEIVAEPNSQGSGAWLNRHQIARKASFTFGDSEETEFVLNHQFGTAYVSTSIMAKEDEVVEFPTIKAIGPDDVSVTFEEAPGNNAIRVIITA
jgi:hypothetical protein